MWTPPFPARKRKVAVLRVELGLVPIEDPHDWRNNVKLSGLREPFSGAISKEPGRFGAFWWTEPVAFTRIRERGPAGTIKVPAGEVPLVIGRVPHALELNPNPLADGFAWWPFEQRVIHVFRIYD